MADLRELVGWVYQKKKKNQNMETQWNKRQVLGITEVQNKQVFQKLD